MLDANVATPGGPILAADNDLDALIKGTLNAGNDLLISTTIRRNMEAEECAVPTCVWAS